MSLPPPSNEELLREPEVVNQTKHNFKTKIGNKYSAKDVIKVWDCISKWIENLMNQNKGVLIKGIGYFTFAQWMINVGKGHPYSVRKPVFVVDEKLAKDFNLIRKRPYNTGNIHERYLCLSSVAENFKLNTDMATHCFKEVVTAFRKLLYENKNCELPFSKIGKLQVKNKTITMKFYQEFLEKQNQNMKDRTEEEENNNHSNSYNSDWNADQYENQNRPCSAMSIIKRPASSLSQYKPGAGYSGVLPDVNDTACRPDSRLSVQYRPDSRLSVQSRPGSRLSVQSRPDSRHSVQSRPDSRHSLQARPGSRLSIHSRPGSRLSVQSRPGSSQSAKCRPASKQAAIPSSSERTRAPSRLSTLSRAEHIRPASGSSAGPGDRPTSRPLSQSSDRNRPASNVSDRCRTNKPNRPPSSTRPTSNCKTRDDFPTITPGGPPDGCTNSKRPTSKTTAVGQNGDICKNTTSMIEKNYDESLCCSCNIRKMRFDKIDESKPSLSSTDNADKFMKGDNLFHKLMNNDSENKRKSRTKEISNYNYVIANKLLNRVNEEKTKSRNENNVESFILVKRPTSFSNRCEKKKTTKCLLLDQIESNKIKTEMDKVASLKNEKLIQEELIKNLHEERMQNIEAKARSKENYLFILNEHMKKKIAEEMKKKDDTKMTTNTFLGTDKVQSQSCPKLNKYKNRELADYQLKQQTARTLANQEQKEKNMKYERNLLNQIKEENETLRIKMLQKKLNQKKFLAEDLKKLLAEAEAERRRNEVPSSYPMSFPLKKMAKRCRLCKKNGLRFPVEKITDLPC